MHSKKRKGYKRFSLPSMFYILKNRVSTREVLLPFFSSVPSKRHSFQLHVWKERGEWEMSNFLRPLETKLTLQERFTEIARATFYLE